MTGIKNSTPFKDRFRMPGEFEPHRGCWMLWPHRGDTWRMGAEPAQKAFVQVACAISEFEPVTMGVSAAQYERARFCLPDHINVVTLPSDDAWMRDVGPTFVVNDHGGIRGVNWKFNAWGGLEGGMYFPWDDDLLVAIRVLEMENIHRYDAPLILEGGSIHVDGQGTLITTKECLLNPNRNPDLDQAQIENYLKQYLNVRKIIWLERGVYMDETDGHVDNLCCFTKPGEVLLHWTDDRDDPQFEISNDALEILSASTDAAGNMLKVHKIPQPGPLYMTESESLGLDQSHTAKPRKKGDRLAGSYVNFYIANNAVIMPFFDDPKDAIALETIRALFPDRQVVGVKAREILLGGGNIHCITQQQPLN